MNRRIQSSRPAPRCPPNSPRPGGPSSAGSAEDAAPHREAALAEVCRLYWPPVFAYLRSQGKHSHDAEDLTQCFFGFSKGEAFSKLRAENGRLRSYLLRSLRNLLPGNHLRKRRLKRVGGTSAVIVDPAALETLAPWIEGSGEEALDRAVDEWEQECHQTNPGDNSSWSRDSFLDFIVIITQGPLLSHL